MEWSQALVLLVTLLHVRAFQTNFQGIERERDELNSHLLAANVVLENQTVELTKALGQAEDAARSKSAFLAAMSHELRTPLNAIIGFSEMISREVFGKIENDRYREYAGDITESGKGLLATVNDILDLSRIDSGNDTMLEDEVDLGELADSIVYIVSAQAKEANIECRLNCPDNLPKLFADARKLKQLLHNIVNNAIKFNVPNGWMELSFSREAGCVVLRVADSGIGMNEDDIEVALSRFQQVDNELARRYEGLGLGLSLAQALASQHGAELAIESERDAGTTVTVTFPRERTVAAVQKAG